jgi:uncharacterized protein with HEPN domain
MYREYNLYLRIHNEIMWDVVRNKIPELQVAVREMLEW